MDTKVLIDTIREKEKSYNDFSNELEKLNKAATGSNDEEVKGYLLYFSARQKEISGDVDAAIELYLQSLNKFNQLNLQEKVSDTLNWLGWNYGYVKSNTELANQYLDRALEVAGRYGYKKGVATSLTHKAVLNGVSGNYTIAIKYLREALEIRKEIGDSVPGTLQNLGIIYGNQGDYFNALECHFESLKLREAAGDKRGIANSYNNIGNIYFDKGDLNRSLEYHEKAFEIRDRIDDKRGLIATLNNLGIVYERLNSYDKALEFHLKSLGISSKAGDKFAIATSHINIAKCSLILGKNQQANESANIAIQLSAEINSPERTVDARMVLATLKVNNNLIEEGNEILYETLQLARNSNLKLQEKLVLEELYTLHKKMKNFEEALNYFEQMMQLKEQIFNDETNRRLVSLQLNFDLEKKEKEAEIERLRNIELKQAFDDLKAAQEELIKKERMAAIGKIASEIAHEVQNPLNFVNNFSELNVELMNELIQELDKNGFTANAREITKSLSANSDAVKQHGKRVSGIVEKLVELTRRGI